MRVAIFGAEGQLGCELRRLLTADPDSSVVALARRAADIANSAQVQSVLDTCELPFDLVVNAAAYNRVDLAEDEPDVAYAVNAVGPRILAEACAARRIPFLHVSTDYVFGHDATRCTPYTEECPPGPLSVYGLSKLAGEQFVLRCWEQSFVIRTCGLYGHAGVGRRGNFVETMLRLGQRGEPLAVVDDQHCTPTSTHDLAQAIIELARTEQYGLYHATNAGATTWCRFAREIFRLMESDVQVNAITTAEFGARADRPVYSVLDCSKLADVINRPLPTWQDALARYLSARPV